MLAHEPRLGVIEDNKLDWLIDPSVAETKLNTLVGSGDSTMPQATGELDGIRGFLGIEADDKRRRMNGVDDVSVMGIGSEVLIVLKGLSEKGVICSDDTHLSPDIPI